MRAVLLNLLNFFLKFGVAIFLFTLFRLLFYFFNYNYFGSFNIEWFIAGLRFDWMTITILFLPFWLSHLLLYRSKSNWKTFLFLLSAAVATIVSVIDLEYYKFIFKRTTADLFTTSGIGADLRSLAPAFVKDYWYLFILAALLIIIVYRFYKLSDLLASKPLRWYQYILHAATILIFLVIGFRGGLQYKPLDIIQAAKYTDTQNVAMVLNTPFTIIKTIDEPGIVEKKYLSEAALIEHIQLEKIFAEDSSSSRPNVVLFILESFSHEYIGSLSGNKTYTPFLDSLIEHSINYSNAYANGKKSIEALPAILSSIPALMNEAYISSRYGSNQIESIASNLKQFNYQSTFYHGGANGTMGFNSFTTIAGFDNYIGAEDYPYQADHDGNWGIYDEPFLKYVAEDLGRKPSPFFATIFTLSSHHPYQVPSKYKDRFPKGNLPILETIGYADHALKQFFKTASKEKWFENTYFIFTADHTAQPMEERYANQLGIYKVPLILYHPSVVIPKEDTLVRQHADIFPTVIDLLGKTDTIISFGNTLLEKEDSYAINYINGVYQLIKGDYLIHFDGEEVIAFYHYRTDPLLKNNLLLNYPDEMIPMKNKIMAIIQTYNARLIKNQLHQ